MDYSEFQPSLAPTRMPRDYASTVETHFFTKDTMKAPTILLIGAFLQIILCAIFPLRWAVVPTLVFLLYSIIGTIFQILLKGPNKFTSNIVPGRVTAQLPLMNGTFGKRPSSQPIVIFNLGVQWNHPLGLLAPGVDELTEDFMALNKDLQERAEELGLLGHSNWRGDDRPSNNTLITTYYFKTLEGIQRFAHDPLHRRAVARFNAKKPSHIGVFHETFCVPAKGWETVYTNCHPVLVGRVADRVEVNGDKMWMNSLVSANNPALKTVYARLGRDENGVLKED